MQVTAVGMRYLPNKHTFTTGEVIYFEPEPKNTHDEHAIKICVDGDHVAYIPKTQNRNVARSYPFSNEYRILTLDYPHGYAPRMLLRPLPLHEHAVAFPFLLKSFSELSLGVLIMSYLIPGI